MWQWRAIGSNSTGERPRAGLVQEKVGDLPRRPPEGAHVGEGVEGAAWAPAGNAGELVEAVHDEVAAPLELGDHPGHGSLVTLKSRQAGQLDEGDQTPVARMVAE